MTRPAESSPWSEGSARRRSGIRCRSRPRRSSPRPARPVEQCQPPRQGHRRAEGEVMGRRHVGQPRLRRRAFPGGDVEPFIVHPHRHEAGAGQLEERAGRQISRILDPHGVATGDQDPADEIDRLLGPPRQDDLRRGRVDAARRPDVPAMAARNGAYPPSSPYPSRASPPERAGARTTGTRGGSGKRSIAGSPIRNAGRRGP